MKRLPAFFVLFFTLCLSAYADSVSVCVYPDNAQIKKYITDFFPAGNVICDMTLKTSPVTTSIEDLRKGDIRLLRYICEASDSQYLMIPIQEDISGFINLQLYVFDLFTSEFKLCYTSLSRNTVYFPAEVILPLVLCVTGEKYSILELEGLGAGTNVLIDETEGLHSTNSFLVKPGKHSLILSEYGSETKTLDFYAEPEKVTVIAAETEKNIYEGILVKSDFRAEVFVDGKSIGFTPLVIRDYTLPLVMRFKAENFADRVITVSEPETYVSVKMKPLIKTDITRYSKSRKMFYLSFARTLLIFGGRVAVNTVDFKSQTLKKNLNTGFNIALGVSAAEMLVRLIIYCKQAENIAP